MVKKAFSVIAFALSILIFILTLVLSFETIRFYIYMKASPGVEMADFGFAFLLIYLCIASLIGILTSAVSLKLSTHKTIETTSYILLIVFVVVFLVICAFITG